MTGGWYLGSLKPDRKRHFPRRSKLKQKLFAMLKNHQAKMPSEVIPKQEIYCKTLGHQMHGSEVSLA
jgi:hypothetical protein